MQLISRAERKFLQLFLRSESNSMRIIINDTLFAVQINSSLEDYPITPVFLCRIYSVLNIAVTSMTSDSFDFIDGRAKLLALKMLSILCHAVVTRERERKREWGLNPDSPMAVSGNTTKRDIAYRFRNPPPPRFPLAQSRLILHREQWFPRKFFRWLKWRIIEESYILHMVHIFYVKNVTESFTNILIK